MNARFMMSICSYASRRAGSNLLALMGAPAVIRNAHGNWKTADVARVAGTEMADVYTEEKEMVSAKAKTLVARTIQLAIKRFNRTDSRWGDIPSVVPKTARDMILDEASRLYTDVKVPDRESESSSEKTWFWNSRQTLSWIRMSLSTSGRRSRNTTPPEVQDSGARDFRGRGELGLVHRHQRRRC